MKAISTTARRDENVQVAGCGAMGRLGTIFICDNNNNNSRSVLVTSAPTHFFLVGIDGTDVLCLELISCGAAVVVVDIAVFGRASRGDRC